MMGCSRCEHARADGCGLLRSPFLACKIRPWLEQVRISSNPGDCPCWLMAGERRGLEGRRQAPRRAANEEG